MTCTPNGFARAATARATCPNETRPKVSPIRRGIFDSIGRRQRLNLIAVIAGGRKAGAGRRRDPEFGQGPLRLRESDARITPSPGRVVNRPSLDCPRRPGIV